MPELPPRDQDACFQEKLTNSVASADLGVSQPVFESCSSSSDSESDNENLSEEIVSVRVLSSFLCRLTWTT